MTDMEEQAHEKPSRSWCACDSVLHWYCGLNSVFEGNLTNSLRPLDPKRSILFHRFKKNVPFLFRPLSGFWHIVTCPVDVFFPNNGLLRGFLLMLSLIVVTLLTLKLYAIHYSKANPRLSLCWDITQFNQMVVFIPIFLVFVAILKDFRSCNRVAFK